MLDWSRCYFDYDIIGVTRLMHFGSPWRLINDCCLLEMSSCLRSRSQDENLVDRLVAYSASSIGTLSQLGLSGWN